MQINNYISEFDELLIKLEKELPKSTSRILEEEKNHNISLLRDQPVPFNTLNNLQTNIWDPTK